MVESTYHADNMGCQPRSGFYLVFLFRPPKYPKNVKNDFSQKTSVSTSTFQSSQIQYRIFYHFLPSKSTFVLNLTRESLKTKCAGFKMHQDMLEMDRHSAYDRTTSFPSKYHEIRSLEAGKRCPHEEKPKSGHDAKTRIEGTPYQ